MRKSLLGFIAGVLLAISGGVYVAYGSPFFTNILQWGDGTASNKRAIANIGAGASNPELRWNNGTGQWEKSPDGTNFSPLGSGSGGTGGINLVDNGSFDAGDTGWTPSGSSTLTINQDSGNGNSGEWDATATGEALDYDLVTVPGVLQGGTCVISMRYSWTGGTANDLLLRAVDGSSNTLVEATVLVTTATQPWAKLVAAFPCPTSGAVRWRLIASATATNPAAIDIDDAYLGSNNLETSLTSAQLALDAEYQAAANCNWQRTNTAVGAFGTDADCGPIVVNYQSSALDVDTTDDDLPTLVIDNLAPGRYHLQVFTTVVSSASGALNTFHLRKDSTVVDSHASQDGSAAQASPGAFQHTWSQTAAGATTFDMACQAASGACSIDLQTATGVTENKVRWVLTRYPLDNELAINLEAQSLIARAEHEGGDCLFTTSSTSYVQPSDATCTFTQTLARGLTLISADSGGNPIPGVRFTPNRVGLYKVTALVSIDTGGTHVTSVELRDLASTRLDDAGFDATASSGASEQLALTGYIDVSAAGVETGADVFVKVSAGTSSLGPAPTGATRTIAWIVEYVEQAYPQPIIPDAVTTPGEGVGMKMVSAQVDNAGTPTLIDQYGGWVDSLSDDGVGNTTINTTVFTEAPICACNRFDTTGGICTVGATTSTTVNIRMFFAPNTPSDYDFSVVCHGK